MRTDQRNAIDGLIVALILCLCGLTLLLLWMSGWSNTARPRTGPGETGEWFGPLVAVVGVLDLFAFLGVVLRLLRSRRAPAGRWVSGAGLLAMLLAVAGAAFVADGLFDGVMRNLVKHCSGAAIAKASRLLALGAFGLLLAAAADVLHRRERWSRVGQGAVPATVFLGLGCFFMGAVTSGWIAWTRTRPGKLKVESFTSAALLLAVAVVAAILLLVLVPLLSKSLRTARERLLGYMPTGTLIGLFLLCPAFWALSRDFRLHPGLRTGTSPAITLNGTVFLHGFQFVVFVLCVSGLVLFEFHDRIRNRLADLTDRRGPVAIAWFGWLSAGTAVLSVAGGAESIFEMVLRPGRSLTHHNYDILLNAAGAMTMLGPVFVVSRLLLAQQENHTSDRYHAMQRAGVLILAAGALGFALGLFCFLGEVGSGAWLSVGAFFLLFSTIAFFALVTVGAAVEFARRRPREDPEPSW